MLRTRFAYSSHVIETPSPGVRRATSPGRSAAVIWNASHRVAAASAAGCSAETCSTVPLSIPPAEHYLLLRWSSMTLTVGTGPFGQRPGGTFNFERPRTKGVIWFEDSPRRIRARLGGETVVDSRHPKLLHEHGHLPIYYFPQDEVDMDLLVPSDKHTTCPYKGEASYWSVHAGGKVAEDAVWSYPEPNADAPPLTGYMAFYWNMMDEWLEEDEPAIIHARDPYHRIDILDTSRPVRVSVNGEQVAETTRARVLYETSLPPRWYIPRADVRMDLLRESDQPHRLCLQGLCLVLVGGRRGERRVVLRRPAARGGAHQGLPRVLQRARRHRGRRRVSGAAGHAVVTALSQPSRRSCGPSRRSRCRCGAAPVSCADRGSRPARQARSPPAWRGARSRPHGRSAVPPHVPTRRRS